MSRKTKPPEESGNAWMDTYADMITLLMTFFLLLYTWSSVDAGKFQAFVDSFGRAPATVAIDALGEDGVIDYDLLQGGGSGSGIGWGGTGQDGTGQGTGTGDGTGDGAGSGRPIDEIILELEGSEEFLTVKAEFEKLYTDIQDYIVRQGLENTIVAEKSGNLLELRFTATLLFASAKADPLPEAIPILQNIGTILKDNLTSIEIIRVEGHTDSRPISTTLFEDNWDLSTKRATNAVRALHSEVDLPMDKMSAVGYGDTKPIDTNDTEAGRQNNRRVCFVIERRSILKDVSTQGLS